MLHPCTLHRLRVVDFVLALGVTVVGLCKEELLAGVVVTGLHINEESSFAVPPPLFFFLLLGVFLELVSSLPLLLLPLLSSFTVVARVAPCL